MADDSNDPWAGLATEQALRRVQHSIMPRWEAWTVTTTEAGIVWCARRLDEGALTHGDDPGRLLEHIAYADDDLAHQQWG